ncbi:hypothetical protein ABFX02_14G299400 [Erythranthe guttata]
MNNDLQAKYNEPPICGGGGHNKNYEEEIKKRMPAVPVYKVSNYTQGDVSTVSTFSDTQAKFYFITRPDARDYLRLTGHDPTVFKVIDTPLSDVVDFEGYGVPIRLVPDLSQVKNAIQVRKNRQNKHIASPDDDTFSGVPIFWCDTLTINSGKEPYLYHPAFLRKEDLDKALDKIQGPRGVVKVDSLEHMINEMKDSLTSKWNDKVIVAPGRLEPQH